MASFLSHVAIAAKDINENRLLEIILHKIVKDTLNSSINLYTML